MPVKIYIRSSAKWKPLAVFPTVHAMTYYQRRYQEYFMDKNASIKYSATGLSVDHQPAPAQHRVVITVPAGADRRHQNLLHEIFQGFVKTNSAMGQSLLKNRLTRITLK